MDNTCAVIRSRHLLLGLAALGIGGAIAAVIPGTADAPQPEAPNELAMVDPVVVPPPAPVAVAGTLSDLGVGDDGVLTIAGTTSLDGAPGDVPISVWIDNEPVEPLAVAEPLPETPADPSSDVAPETTDAPTEGATVPAEAAEPEPTEPETTEPPTTEPVLAAETGDPGAFKAVVQLREGPQRVCAIAENDAGPDAVLGCENVMYRAQLVEGKMIISDYGSGATPRLGIAGEGTPFEAAERVAQRAREWEEQTGIPTIPAFDYIQTVAQASPGSDGDYSAHTSREDLDIYLEAIRSVDGILILDFQPGGGRFMKQISQYEEYLRQPDVGLALDTEWRMPWGVAPATVIGYADADEINEVGEYLANIVAEDNLPQKAFVIHQFTKRMVRNREAIIARPELATIFHIDGHGTKLLKRGVYQSLLPSEEFYTGFKLFFDEDTGLMTPLEVRDDLARIPAMISYQ